MENATKVNQDSFKTHVHLQPITKAPANMSYRLVLCKHRRLEKVRKRTKIRTRYNQVPHLTQDTTSESSKTTINITNKNQEVSPFPEGDHKAALNRRESMRNERHKNTNGPQKKYRLGTVSKIFYWKA